jgi:homoserine dehydrogenase
MRLILVGFGTVGQGLAEILRDKSEQLRLAYGFDATIVGVHTLEGSVYSKDGLDIDGLLVAAQKRHMDHYPDAPGLERGWDALQMIRAGGADTLIEAAYTNLKTAQPALDTCLAAFANGLNVVLANKGPVALAYDQLVEAAARARKLLRFEATVMSGTPSIRLAMQSLAGCEITEAKGILNGTTNYILTQMEGGLDYAAALAQAQSLGYDEADPTGDVDGWDAAAKAVILARAVFGQQINISDLDVTGIRGITPADIDAARTAGERWKLIARVSSSEASVAPVRIPLTSPLAGVSGPINAVTYTTDLLGEVTLVGPGAGRAATGFALLSDLLDIHKETRVQQ